jgi:lysozyme
MTRKKIERVKSFMKGFFFSTILAGSSLAFLEKPRIIYPEDINLTAQGQSQPYKKTLNTQDYFLTLNSLQESPKPKEDKSPILNRISDKGLGLIKNFEGFSPNPYPDGNGYSIGYGHQILPGENYNLITREKAEELLQNDAKIAKEAVEKYVKIPLNQNQYDALCSLVYNIGQGAFRDSTLLKKLNSKDYESAGKEILRWNKYKKEIHQGLVNRRNLERKLFLKKSTTEKIK